MEADEDGADGLVRGAEEAVIGGAVGENAAADGEELGAKVEEVEVGQAAAGDGDGGAAVGEGALGIVGADGAGGIELFDDVGAVGEVELVETA